LQVEFVLGTAHLRQTVGQLKANRGEHIKTDYVDMLVAEHSAVFRSIGTEVEWPVEESTPGSVRVPLEVLDKITGRAHSFKKKKLLFHCEPGSVKVETWLVKHPGIELGKGSEPDSDLPVDMPVLETLAFAKARGANEIGHSMRARIRGAMGARQSAVSRALEVLEGFGVTEDELQALIEMHVLDVSKGFSGPRPAA